MACSPSLLANWPIRGQSSERLAELEAEVRDLQITNRAKDLFLEQLKSERSQFLENVSSKSHRIGELEAQLRLLESPREGSRGLNVSGNEDLDQSGAVAVGALDDQPKRQEDATSHP